MFKKYEYVIYPPDYKPSKDRYKKAKTKKRALAKAKQMGEGSHIYKTVYGYEYKSSKRWYCYYTNDVWIYGD